MILILLIIEVILFSAEEIEDSVKYKRESVLFLPGIIGASIEYKLKILLDEAKP